MAIVLKDRVKQSASAPGTGTITLGAIAAGFQAFSAIGNGNVTYFAIVDPISGDWEVNYGTYTTSGTTLTRNATPLSSSAAGALVNFTGTVDVFCTYPSEKAIYEETGGNVLIDGGPITVIGSGVTTYSTFAAALGEMYANINSFAQFYAQNLNDGTEASADFVAYNDLGDGVNNFVDVGINSSNYTSATYPIFTPGSAYVFNDGGEMIIGSATDDVLLFAGGVATTDWAARIDKTTKALTTKADVNVGGALDVTGAAVFGSTVLLDANPTLALQAATKQYVDNQVTAGLHIHAPVRVETTGNLTAAYAQGGTTFNITAITGTDTVTTSANHGLSIGDQIWLYSTAGNGLSTNVAYFVFSTPALNTLTLSLTYGGSQITGLTNASGLTYATRANSGVGATLTNSGAQAALNVDGIALSANDRIMVRLQTNGEENGVYTVTTVGSGSTNWVLTRATDSDAVNPADPDGVGTGDYYFTQEGTLNAGDSHVLTTEPNTMIIGYTPLTYTQFSGSVDYTGGTNITVTGQTISVSGTIAATLGGTGTSTVTTGDILYGSATDTWSKLPKGAGYRSLLMNAGGTQIEWNAVALNQSNAVSGTLAATNGGTGLNAYTLGDIVYSSAANTLAALAGNTTTTKKFLVQTGTGAASAAPTWDVVNGADVNGNISGSAGSVANALTFGTYLTGGTYNGSSAVTATVDATSANTASKVVARDASGNFSAGTITATLNGTATSTASATNLSGGAANQVVYQSGSGTTAFVTAPSASNQVLNWNGSAFTWSAGTISGVPLGSNLNSLTAGTYLSGTAYNGSAAQTWSVNATSANTASTVVARDGSGNFSAGTITASLSGNASTATSAGSATSAGYLTGGDSSFYGLLYNSLAGDLNTYNSPGLYSAEYVGTTNRPTGSNGAFIQISDAGGTDVKTQWYFPSSGVTPYMRLMWGGGNWLSWQALLTSGNYNSYAPTLTGGGASGTWGINITGSAGSAGSSTSVSATTATGIQSSYSTTINTTTPGLANYGIVFSGHNTSDNAAGITWAWSGTNAQAGIYVQSSGAYGTKMYFGTTDSFATGSKTSMSIDHNGVIQVPRNYLQSDYSLRAPIFYDSNDTSYYVNPNGMSYISSVQIAGYNSASSALMLNWPTSGYIGVYGSVVNSAKLLNFRGTGGDSYRVSTAQLGGAAYVNGDATSDNGSAGVIIAPGGARYATTASTVTGAIKITIPEPVSDVMCTMTIRVYTYDGAAYEITCGGYPYGTAGTAGFVNTFAYMNTQRRGTLNVRFGTDGSNACIWIGETGTTWNYPQVAVIDFTTGYYGRDPKHYADGWGISFVSSFNTVFNSINVYAPVNSSSNSGAAYAPIFYDSNDTNYYVDPNSMSRMVRIDFDNLYYGPNSNYGIIGTSGYFDTVNSGYAGDQLELNYVRGTFVSISHDSMRAPLFYDYDNTGYYLDPASTSNLNQVNLQSFLRRNTSAAGYLEGNYPTSTDSNSSSCIYTIGGAYQPGTTSLGNMYGIGYTVGNGTANPGLGLTGWGLYVASGGTSRIFLDSDSGIVISSGSTRSPIFYDRDNTSYYLDPASTNSLRTVGDWRSDSAAWTGEFSGKMQYHSSNWYLQFASNMIFRRSDGTNVMTCDSGGNVTFTGNVTAYSDARIKENIVTIDSALDKVLHLRGVYYNKIGNPERRVGVIAQEVLEILPEVVRSVSDTNPSTGETTELLAVDYGNITGLLIEAVKQLSAKVDELQRRA